MLFNSREFLLFLPIVFGLYWFVVQRNLKAQNMLLVIASYVFYGWWDWRFLGLIAFSTLVDYLVGLQIEGAQEKRAKKAWLGVSLLVNLGAALLFQIQQLLHRQLGRCVGFGGRDDARVVAQGDFAGGHQLLYVSDPLLFH